MLDKIVKRCLLCMATCILLCGCSAPQTAESDSNVADNASDSEALTSCSEALNEKKARSITIHYCGHLGEREHKTEPEQNGGFYMDNTIVGGNGTPTEPHTTYSLTSDGKFTFHNDYDCCMDDVSCTFSQEKVAEYYELVASKRLTIFETYHPNADGVMVNDYPAFGIVFQYDDFSYMTFELSETDYTDVLSMAESMKQAAERQNNVTN